MLTTTPARPTPLRTFGLMLAALVLALGFLTASPAAEDAQADNSRYVTNSCASEQRIKVRTFSGGKNWDVYVYPCGSTGKGRVIYPGGKYVWLPRCNTRHSSLPGQPTAVGGNKLVGSSTFTVKRC